MTQYFYNVGTAGYRMGRWARVVLLLSGVAWTSPVMASAANAPAAAASAPAAATDAPASGLEEIVVTAQRRSESQQNVPISIAVASAKQIAAAGLVSAQELSVITPGLNLGYSRNAVTPYLRGIGTQNNLPGGEQAVAVYVDGVYYPSPAASIFAFNNIERVEVLKGPQGTLFGRNATGGLIHVITRDPSETTEADATMSYGNYDTLAGSAYVTGKLANGVAADLAFTASNQGTGFGRNVFLGNEVGITRRWAVRSKVKAELSPSDTLILSGDYSSQVSDAGDGERQTAPGYVSIDGYTHVGGKYDSNSDVPFDYPGNRGNFYGGSVKYIHDFSKNVTLTSLTAYRHWDNPSFTDADSTPLVLSEAMFRVRGHSFQEELLLNGKSGRLEWTVLGFYLNSRDGETTHIFTVPHNPQNVQFTSILPTISYAGAAQGTYAITPTTHFTLGGRYTEDEKSIRGSVMAAAGNTYPVGTLITCTAGIAGCVNYVPAAQTSEKYNAATWRVALDQKLAPAVLVYISANRGFKAGAYNASSIGAPPVKPEHLTAFEGGIKADITRELRFNASAFYYKYTGIQLQATVPPFLVPQTYNAAAGRVKGLDLEGIWSPEIGAGRLTLRGAADILDPKYTSFPGAPAYAPIVNAMGVQTGGNIVSTIDASGKDFIRASRFTSSLSANYGVPVSALLKMAANVAWEYNGGFYWNPDNRIKQSPYDLVNAQLSLGRKDETWTARLWVKNLTNAYYAAYLNSGGMGNTSVPGDPRTYGMAVDVKF